MTHTKKDWIGNNKAVYTCLGASNHALEDRETEDYYATDPKAAELLLEVEPELNNIWECACGEGHLAKVFNKVGKLNLASDLIDRGYGNAFFDFLDRVEEGKYEGDIVTNPPYKFAKEFIEKALGIIKTGRKVAMFLKVTFLEGKARKEFFKKNPPKTIYVCSGRIPCAKNGDFNKYPSSAIAYAWYVWEKGFTGKPTVEWIN